jgi:hypothetical protein
MPQLPLYLWVLTLAGVVGILASTCVVVYGGAVRAGAGRRESAALVSGMAVLFAGWLVVSSLIAGAHGYQAQLGRQIPWMPLAVAGWFVLLLALTRIPVMRRALIGPRMGSRLLLPHTFRLAEGIVFLAAMVLGLLPALFAVPAGLGDIAVGIAAPFVGRRVEQGRGTATWFTVLGIIDLVLALALGALIGFQLLPSIPPAPTIGSLPIVLVPTVAVPVLLILHITTLAGHRAARQQETDAPQPAIHQV